MPGGRRFFEYLGGLEEPLRVSVVDEILLSTKRTAVDWSARFVVPFGTEEVHVEMSLQPLS